MEPGFEIIEHTADVGIEATGRTLTEALEQAAYGLADIIGIGTDEKGEHKSLRLEGGDSGALLVDFLSEIIYLHDSRDAFLGRIQVDSADESELRATIELVERGSREPTGTQVKAITYHGLVVEPRSDGWFARVYVDV